ncbi:MAG: hypothetical protein R3E95_11570 [Thiolinea sp.]
MSEVSSGMADTAAMTSNNLGTNNDIRLPENKCGTVYALELDDDYVATTMHGVVSGTPIDGDANNSCDLDGIANPDNVTFIPATKPWRKIPVPVTRTTPSGPITWNLLS